MGYDGLRGNSLSRYKGDGEGSPVHLQVAYPAMAFELLARRRRLLTLSGSMSQDSAPAMGSTGASLDEHDRARHAKMSTTEMTYWEDSKVVGGGGRPSDAVTGGSNMGESNDDTGERGGDDAGVVRINTRDEDVA